MATLNIHFEMSGGPYDGQILSNTADDLAETFRVQSWYTACGCGAVGQRIRVDSETPLADLLFLRFNTPHFASAGVSHVYEVTGREEKFQEVSVRAEYLGYQPAAQWTNEFDAVS